MSVEGAKSRPFRGSCGSENQVNLLKKELMDLAKQRTTGKVYYGESGPGTGHEQAVTTGGCWRC